MRRILFGLILTFMLQPLSLFGQRVISQLKPDPIAANRTLSLSSNYITTDGRTVPNIVFSSWDGNVRGFVSYPAVLDTSQNPPRLTSDPGAVVVFNPRAEPEILEDGTRRIKPEKIIPFGAIGTPPQPARPMQMSLAPDGRVIAVVNENSGALSIIDVASAELKGTTLLSGERFAFGNNLVFLPGGTLSQGYTAYITSYRQNAQFVPIEGVVLQLRIRPDYAVEVTGRLTVGIGPTAAVLSDDGSLLAVLSTFYRTQGGRVIFPAYISLIDTAGFRMRAELRPNANETFLFDANTTPAFVTVSDGSGRTRRVLVVGAQGQLRVSPPVPGRAMVFDTEGAGLLATADIGFSPSVTSVMPSGSPTMKTVFITNADPLVGSVHKVDLDGTKIFSDSAETRQQGIAQQTFTATGPLAPATGVVFPFDQARPFVPVASSAGFDRLISFDTLSGAVDTSLIVGDVLDRVTDYSASAVPTPDRQIMAILNMATGTIDMVINGYHLDYPFLVSSDVLFTRLNVINPGPLSPAIGYSLLTDGGVPLVSRPPITAPLLTVPSRGQFGQTAFSLFDLDRSQTNNGWIDLSTDTQSMLGSYLVGNTDTGSLDGGLPVYRHVSRRYTRLVFPVVFSSDRDFSQITLVNPTYSQASITLTLYKPTGEPTSAQPVTANIPGRAKFTRFIADIFTSGLDEFTYGYLKVDSNVGLIGFANNIYQTGENKFSIAGENPVPALSSSPNPTLFYLPLVSLGGGNSTVLSLVNLAAPPPDESTPPVNADITITVYNQNGVVVREPVRRTLGPQKQLREDLLSLLGAPDLPPMTGWARIELANPNAPVFVDATLFGPGRSYAGTVPVLYQGGTDFYFVEVINSKPADEVFLTEPLVTSLALANLESFAVSVTLDVFDANGVAVPGARATFTVDPQKQVAKFLDDLLPLPRSLEMAGGSIRVQSTGRVLAAQGVFAADLGARDYFVILPPQSPQ